MTILTAHKESSVYIIQSTFFLIYYQKFRMREDIFDRKILLSIQRQFLAFS